jgi:hypothetical protein
VDGENVIAVYVTPVGSSVVIAWTCVTERSDLMQQRGCILAAEVR